MKIKLTKEQQELLNAGTIVNTPENGTYHYLPFCYKETKDKNLFEIISPEKLPKDFFRLIGIIQEPNTNVSLPTDKCIEEWWAGEMHGQKFWQEAPFRTNGDIIEEIKTAIKYFLEK